MRKEVAAILVEMTGNEAESLARSIAKILRDLDDCLLEDEVDALNTLLDTLNN